jgi:hypothetical protein
MAAEDISILRLWFKQYLFDIIHGYTFIFYTAIYYKRIEKKAISSLYKVSLLGYMHGLYYGDTNANKSK